MLRNQVDERSERSVIVREARAGSDARLTEILRERVGFRVEAVSRSVKLAVVGQVFRLHRRLDADDAPLMFLVSVHHRAIRTRLLIIAVPVVALYHRIKPRAVIVRVNWNARSGRDDMPFDIESPQMLGDVRRNVE